MGVEPFSQTFGMLNYSLLSFSGGLRYASTTGYYLAAFPAA